MSDNNHRASGVGTLSVLVQDSLEESVNNIHANFGKSGSKGLLEVFEEAQNEAGTGLYQIMLLIVCGLVNMSCAISSTAVSFIIPPAENDFNLNSTTKGILNGAPFLGMMFGAYFWGFFGDFKGRRFVILGSMGMDTLFSIFSCFTQGNVILFIIIRLGNGFAIIGAICMIYVYLGEFLTPEKRDGYLLFLEIFWILGMIVNPGVAMIVIPSNIILLPHTYFSLNAWRVFILLTSIPSLISFILIYQFPETPRYLILSGHMSQSWEVLEKIYLVNRKNKTEPYKVQHFTRTFSMAGIITESIPFMTNLKKKLVILKNCQKILFSDHCRTITITCIIEFCLMTSYVAVLVWIPELFSRYYNFKILNSDGINICLASEWLLNYNSEYSSKSIEKLVSTVSIDAYLAAFIIALATMPLAIIMGIIIKCVNKKILLYVSCGVPIIVSLLMTITKNDLQAEIMCFLFEGFTTLTEPIIFCCMVELFPSNVIGVAFSMTVMIGRLGAVFGIVIFGVMIDKNCFMIFYMLAVLLTIAGLSAIFLPKLKIGGSH